MIGSATTVLLRCTVVAVLLGAVFAGSAHAGPVWCFNGVEFNGLETVSGDAGLGSFTTFGISVACENTHYEMDISNKSKVGQASVKWLLFSPCTATGSCTVEAIEAEKFPWPSSLVTVGGQHYLVMKSIDITIYFGSDAGCALSEIAMPITGSAGALYDNPTETFAFSAAGFKATGTKLSAFGFEKADWAATFTTEAEFHEGETLTVG